MPKIKVMKFCSDEVIFEYNSTSVPRKDEIIDYPGKRHYIVTSVTQVLKILDADTDKETVSLDYIRVEVLQ